MDSSNLPALNHHRRPEKPARSLEEFEVPTRGPEKIGSREPPRRSRNHTIFAFQRGVSRGPTGGFRAECGHVGTGECEKAARKNSTLETD